MGAPLTPGQASFVSQLSARTGINPGVATAWVLAEENGGAAQSREASHNHDWLNVGYTDSKTLGAGNNVWRDPISAANATAAWIKGQWNDPGFGKAAPGIQAIARAGSDPMAQINAIGRSGWATDPAYGSNIASLFHQFGGGAPPAHEHGGSGPSHGTQGQNPPAAPTTSTQVIPGTAPSTSIDYNSAIINSLLHSGMGKFDGNSRNLGLGGGLLSKILGAVDSGQYTTTTPGTPAKTVTTKTYGISTPGQPAPPTANHGRYTSPVPGAIIGRTDMGVDANLPEGHPVVAMGDSKVVGISPNWFQGQPYLLLQLTSGPSAGRFWYVAEGITPTVHPGQFVKQGQTIATFHQGGTGMELGWGSPTPGRTLAQATTGYTEGQVTKAGADFAHLFGWNVRSG